MRGGHNQCCASQRWYARSRARSAERPRRKCSRKEESLETAGSSACGREVSSGGSGERGCEPAGIDASAGGARTGPRGRDPDVAGSIELAGKIRAEFNVILLARALAMIMFRSGGYAACDAEFHPPSPRVPPTSDVCVRCVQVREDSLASAGCRPGVQRNVVYFCARAPKAQSGNVM
eukprot:5647876-Pleurochrysis_carterae.AAC.1